MVVVKTNYRFLNKSVYNQLRTFSAEQSITFFLHGTGLDTKLVSSACLVNLCLLGQSWCPLLAWSKLVSSACLVNLCLLGQSWCPLLAWSKLVSSACLVKAGVLCLLGQPLLAWSKLVSSACLVKAGVLCLPGQSWCPLLAWSKLVSSACLVKAGVLCLLGQSWCPLLAWSKYPILNISYFQFLGSYCHPRLWLYTCTVQIRSSCVVLQSHKIPMSDQTYMSTNTHHQNQSCSFAT